MAKEWYKSFLNSKRWKRCRDSYIKYRVSVDGGMCEECRENLGYIVHHKKHVTEANVNVPDVALNHDNLMYVCKECHDMYEGHGIGGHGKKNHYVSLMIVENRYRCGQSTDSPLNKMGCCFLGRPTANIDVTHRSRV